MDVLGNDEVETGLGLAPHIDRVMNEKELDLVWSVQSVLSPGQSTSNASRARVIAIGVGSRWPVQLAGRKAVKLLEARFTSLLPSLPATISLQKLSVYLGVLTIH